MTNKTRVGIIGVGQIGKHHVDVYSQMPDVEIVAIADVDEAEAKRVAAQSNIPCVFTQFRDLLNVQEIQAVDVCLHNNFHAPVSIAAMQAGKDVFCEKPMAGAYVDALAMYDAAKRLGRRLQIQCQNLFSKETKAARRLIDAGALGRLYYGRSHGFRRRGRPYVDGYGTSNFVRKATASGGALYDMGVYHLIQMLYLLGNPEVLTVAGETHQELPMYQDRRDNSQYDVEELGLGFVRLKGDVTLAIEESWAMHYDDSESSKLLGSLGGLKLHPLTFYSAMADMETDSTFKLDLADWRWHQCTPDFDAYDSPQRHWIATLQGRVEPIDTASLALGHMLIAEGIYLSKQLGREVTPEEVRAHSVSTARKDI
jgi:predicted dehydrogenase